RAAPYQGLTRRDIRNSAAELSLRAVLHAPRELTAGGVDIFAARLANGRHDVALDQRPLERQNALTRRRPKLRSRKRIERNEIDLARRIAQQREQLARRRRIVVDAVEHHIFERDEVARRFFQIPSTRGQKFVERMLAIDRYETIA